MADQRNEIMKALDVQSDYEGDTVNIRLCRIIARHIKSNHDWQSLVSVQHHRYGTMSYQAHRFYYVKDWVEPMVAELSKTISG